MKKYVLDLQVSAVEHPNSKYTLIKLTDKEPLPQMLPGQFVEGKDRAAAFDKPADTAESLLRNGIQFAEHGTGKKTDEIA